MDCSRDCSAGLPGAARALRTCLAGGRLPIFRLMFHPVSILAALLCVGVTVLPLLMTAAQAVAP